MELQPKQKKRQRKKKDGEPGKEPKKKRKNFLPPVDTDPQQIMNNVKDTIDAVAAGAGTVGLTTSPIPTPMPPSPQEEVDFAALTEQIMQQLRSLPMLPLQEPEIHTFHSLSPVCGSGTLTGKGRSFSNRGQWVLGSLGGF